ncbi:MAG: hypothetical protein Q9216_001548 [Gyalolechia sp. 2 TL-2023]
MENPVATLATKTPTVESSPKSLRILCFGDSLTSGYSEFGYSHHPYAKQIREKLKEALPDTQATVDVAGQAGDQVIAGQFLKRMKGICAKVKDAPYDWIIVLGGTNDLGWSETADKIYEALGLASDSEGTPTRDRLMLLSEKVWKVALDTGANVLALSVLEAEYTSGDIVQRRKELNNLIAYHQEDRLYSLDLCAAVPYFTMNDVTRETIWDDGLHLTAKGYEMMGNVIATKLLELINSVTRPPVVNKTVAE